MFRITDLVLGAADIFHLSDESGLALAQRLLQLIESITDLRHGLVFPARELLGDLIHKVNGSCQLR